MIHAEVKGIPDFRAALKAIPEKLRKRALRNALAAGGRIVRDEAKRNAPVLQASAKEAPFRKPGTLRNAISVRTSKADRRAGNVGVFVNVRPAKSGQRGAKSPNDPFYFRFVNWGTKHMRGFKFLEKGAGQLPAALQEFIRKIGPAIEKLNKPKATAP